MFWTGPGTQIVFGVACVGVLFKISVSPEKENCFAEMTSSGTLSKYSNFKLNEQNSPIQLTLKSN